MSVTKLLVLAALCAAAAPSCLAAPAEAEFSSRLESRAEEALARMLGPGRAAVVVEVRGERVVKKEVSTISGSGGKESPEAAVLELPGYTRTGAPRTTARPASTPTLIHSASDELQREGSFVPTRVRAWLVVDKALAEASVAEAARVTGELLALDRSRGDELSVVRTAFLPSWRAAFARARDVRNLMLLLLAAGSLVLAAAVLGRAATRSARALADGLAKGRSAPVPVRGLPPAPARRIIPLPPLDKGGRG